MNAPFYKFGLFGDETSLIVAFVIGIGFGFFLERAGFGSSRKLAAQFYFRDLSVLKVMFTAIVTAMTGLYVCSRLGMVDLSLVYLTDTHLVPQIVGGLILGVGFVIGGYCPGTSVVSAATGRIDGMVYLAGVVAGLFGYGEIHPKIEKFTHLTPMGKVTLPELLHLPYGLVVLAVVVMALAAFAAAEWAEGKFGGKPAGEGSLTAKPWRLTPVRGLAAALLALGGFAVIAGDPYRGNRVSMDTGEMARMVAGKADHVDATEVADWILASRADYTLVDLRSADEYATYHIPGAVNIPLAELNADVAPRTEKVVLYSDGGIHGAQAWMLLKALGFKAVYSIYGGLDAWKDDVLFPVAPPESDTNAQAAFRMRAEVSKHFGGKPRGASESTTPDQALPTPPPTAPAGTVPRVRRRKKEGC